MRCCCCNVVLNDFEATRRSAATNDFLDMCNKCIKGLDIKTIDREDLPQNGEKSSIYEDSDYLDWANPYDEAVLRDDSEE